MRGMSPNRPSTSRNGLVRPRRSKRNDWTEYSEANQTSTVNIPQDSTLEMIPKHWTTKSGKFDPQKSEYGFDNRSNSAMHANRRNARRRLMERNNESSNDEMSNGDSEDSQENASNTSNEEQKKKKKALVEGEIQDPHERHQFYKKLKKSGIKRTFEFADNWETHSANSEISEISVGNASYILDLAQQKESRKTDRQEEALEEALELYGTWLTEGKNDDQNIFLMILHEVKKEQKEKYKEADKRHTELLDAALDDELKRREQVKNEDQEEEARQQEETEYQEMETIEEMSPGGRIKKKLVGSSHSSSDHSRSNHSTSSRRKSFYRHQNDSKISAIITKQKSKDEADDDSNSNDKDSYDSNASFADLSRDSQDEDDFLNPTKPLSRISRSSSHSRTGKLRLSFHRRNKNKESKQSTSNDSPENPSLPKEQSKGLFGRLRRTLSQRQAEQWKFQETSWRDYSAKVSAEEKWWKKINDTKKDTVLFGHAKDVLDMTNNTAPRERPSSAARLDFTNRTCPPGSTPGSSIDGHSIDSIIEEEVVKPKKKKSTKDLSSKKKKKSDRRRSVSGDMPSKHERKSVPGEKSSKHQRRSVSSEMPSKHERLEPLKFDLEVAKDDSPKNKDKKKKKKSKSKNKDSHGSLEGFIQLNDVAPKKKKKDSDDRSLDARSIKSNKSTRSKSGRKKRSKSGKRLSHSFSGSDDSIDSHNSVDWTDRCIIRPTASEDSGGLTAVTVES